MKDVVCILINPKTLEMAIIRANVGRGWEVDNEILEEFSPDNTKGEIKRRLDKFMAAGFSISNWHVVSGKNSAVTVRQFLLP